MSPRSRIEIQSSIDAVLRDFAADRASALRASDGRLYRHILFLLELCINNYGHRNLDAEERAWFEDAYYRENKDFFELFGPDKLLPELDFFSAGYLTSDVHTSERVVKQAPAVVEELRQWLLDRGLVSPDLVDRERARVAARRRLRRRVARLLSALAPTVLSVDAHGLPSGDYVACDHHPVSRVEARRLWLSVFREGAAHHIGPVIVPELVSSVLRPAWSISGALGRVRGRWRFVDLVGIYPRV